MMFSPRVHIVGKTTNRSFLEVVPVIISSNDTIIVEPQIHVEDELFSISLISESEIDTSPFLTQLQDEITNYLDEEEIDYIVHEDGMTSFISHQW